MARSAALIAALWFYSIALFFPIINAYLNKYQLGYVETYHQGLTMFFCFIVGSIFVATAKDISP